MRFANISPVIAIVTMLCGPAFAQDGDAAKGEKIFKKCKACHMIGDGAKNRTGPLLTGIYQNAAGQNPDFKYSKGMKTKADGGLIWTAENLDIFLSKPRDLIAKTRMSFPGLKKESDRADVIAYLATFE